MKLSPAERSSVILIDVIGYSLSEIGEIMEVTIPAVKAALHRGRTRLKALSDSGDSDAVLALTEREHERLARYVDRFNARDFDAVHDMLAEDVRLELRSAGDNFMKERKLIAAIWRRVISSSGSAMSSSAYLATTASRRSRRRRKSSAVLCAIRNSQASGFAIEPSRGNASIAFSRASCTMSSPSIADPAIRAQ
jgi:predicted transcriptional regulator